MSSENRTLRDKTVLVEKLRDMGVVGADGSGFPTHVKLDSECDTVIAAGIECEPLLAGDKFLLERETEKIINGLDLVIQACGAQGGVIALKEKETQLAASLKKAIGGRDNIELFLMDDFYPAGAEQILVHEVTGRIVPEAGCAEDVGCIVAMDDLDTGSRFFWAEVERSDSGMTVEFMHQYHSLNIIIHASCEVCLYKATDSYSQPLFPDLALFVELPKIHVLP